MQKNKNIINSVRVILIKTLGIKCDDKKSKLSKTYREKFHLVEEILCGT